TPPMGEGSPGTRATRLGVLALFWNHFQHMFSYWDVLESQGVDWEAALREALTRAALTDDHQDYLTILRHLMAVLKDGHITVYSPFAPAVSLGEAMPRFHWDVIEGAIT